MTATTYAPTMTADEHRAAAADHEREAHDSFERSDTDGALSQWASGINAAKERALANLAEAGGMADFRALLDLDGNLVPARIISTTYGSRWAIFASADDANRHGAPVVEWLPVGADTKRKINNLAKRGYREGYVRRPARIIARESGRWNVWYVPVPAGDDFDPAAEIVDDGAA